MCTVSVADMMRTVCVAVVSTCDSVRCSGYMHAFMHCSVNHIYAKLIALPVVHVALRILDVLQVVLRSAVA
jgi:hypothetical protein